MTLNTIFSVLIQQGWSVQTPIIITTRIRGYIHTTITQSVLDLKIPTNKVQTFMKTLSQITVRYLTHIFLNKRIHEKKPIPIP